MAFRTTATFRRGGTAVAASEDPATLSAQIDAALAGGPVPIPAWHSMFDPAARPSIHYRPGLICRSCGATFSLESDAARHDGSNIGPKSRASRGHSTTYLPPIQGA